MTGDVSTHTTPSTSFIINFISFKIKNFNCRFRVLSETDVNQDYIDGLKQQKQYIINIPKNINISRKNIPLSVEISLCSYR